MKATLIKNLTGFRGDARLFQLDPPLDGIKYVVVSGIECAVDTGRPETYIFKANSRGEITDWCELDGSFRGAVDHARALKGAGYSIN